VTGCAVVDCMICVGTGRAYTDCAVDCAVSCEGCDIERTRGCTVGCMEATCATVCAVGCAGVAVKGTVVGIACFWITMGDVWSRSCDCCCCVSCVAPCEEAWGCA
jgi:hypothetical protein